MRSATPAGGPGGGMRVAAAALPREVRNAGLAGRPHLRHIRSSAQKTGLVLDQIRGRDVGQALATLKFLRKMIAKDVEKVLRSAIANASQREGFSGRCRSLTLCLGVLRQSGREHEAHSPGPDGPRLPRREAFDAHHGRGGRTAGERSRHGSKRWVKSSSLRIPMTNKTWRARWYADKDYAKLLHQDIKLRANRDPVCAAGADRYRARQQTEGRHPHLAAHHHRAQGRGRQAAAAGAGQDDGL